MIVIGAGIAGLAAAQQLARHGCAVTVLEAADRPGGRMSTDVRDGYRIDRGAQFLSTGYATLGAMLERTGLATQLVPTSQCSATIRAQRTRRASAERPWTVAASGLLAWKDLVRLGVLAGMDASKAKQLPLDRYDAWHAWDDQDVSAWVSKRFGTDVLEYIFEPMLEGFFFQTPEETSRALALLLWSYGARRFRTVALRLGMGSLSEALAGELDVRLSTPALALECRASEVCVTTPSGDFHADHVILATTASAARRLYREAHGPAAALLATPYSATINIGIALPGGIVGSAVSDDVYGLLIPRRERQVIAAVGIESRKSPDLVRQGELLNVMLDGKAGARLVGASEEDVLALVLPELEKYFPGVREGMSFAHFCRWREAEPCSPVGRSRAIRAYWDAFVPGQQVILAGDYLSTPTTEGAAQSGILAANSVLDYVRS